MIHYNNLITKIKNDYFLTLLTLLIILFFVLFFLLYYYYMRNKVNRVVVFDLDETIGCFQQLAIFCEAIEKFNKKKISRYEFMKLLDLYPEYFRPNLFTIMKFLKEKKIKGDLQKVCLYTNNNGPKEWARRICLYIDGKVGYKLFDNHVGAYMVNGEQIEMGRTSHDKTVEDLLRTTRYSKSTEICFIDDLYHEKMDTDNVYYIHVEPYRFALSNDKLIMRYYNSHNLNIPYSVFNKIITNYIDKFNISDLQTTTDINHNLTGKEILQHLKNFLQPLSKSTKKNKATNKNVTIRK